MEAPKISTAKRTVLITTSFLSWLAVVSCMVLIFFLARLPMATLQSAGQVVSNQIMKTLSWRVAASVLITVFYVVVYAFLALLCYIGLLTADSASTKRATIVFPKFIKTKHDIYASFSIWVSFLYAMTDQYHQLFIDDRTASMLDLMYYLGGMLLMVSMLGLVIRIRTGVIKRRIRKEAHAASDAKRD